jgi:hypothetical protein
MTESRASNARFENDPDIPDTAVLWRRVPARHYVFDENLGRNRPSSEAFEDNPDGTPMSVFLASDCTGPEVALAGHEGYGLVAIAAGLARQCNQAVARDPSEGPAHVVVVGKKTSSIKTKFAKQCTEVVPAARPDLSR